MKIIDRFEETFAVIETDSGMQEIPRSLLPPEAREGDVITARPDGTWSVDAAATELRRKKLRNRLKNLRDK